MIGKTVIVRSSPSGVHFGTLESVEGNTVVLVNSRRLWRWWAAEGVSLNGVAAKGLHPDHLHECRISADVDRIMIFEVCEIIEVTDEAAASIESQPARTS